MISKFSKNGHKMTQIGSSVTNVTPGTIYYRNYQSYLRLPILIKTPTTCQRFENQIKLNIDLEYLFGFKNCRERTSQGTKRLTKMSINFRKKNLTKKSSSFGKMLFLSLVKVKGKSSLGSSHQKVTIRLRVEAGTRSAWSASSRRSPGAFWPLPGSKSGNKNRGYCMRCLE